MVLNSIGDEDGGCVRRHNEFVNLTCTPSVPPKVLLADSEYKESILDLNGIYLLPVQLCEWFNCESSICSPS